MHSRTCTQCGRILAIGILVPALLSSFACSQKPEPPPFAYSGPTVASASLGVEDAKPVPTGYKLLDDEPSSGRFPGAIAIARLIEPKDFWRSDNTQAWEVGDIGYEEAITWNSLGNRMPAVREMIVLDKNSTVSPTADLKKIAHSAARLEAGMCLIYGPASTEAEHAALWGVIVDSHTLAKLAFIQADAGPADFEPPPSDRLPQDRRHWDVNYLARTKFQQQARQCILALIERDRPPSTTQPSPWNTKPVREQPIYLLPPRPTPTW